MPRKDSASDEEILRMLELRDEGYSFSEIARRMRGVKRNQVLGIISRVNKAADAESDVLNGTMPYGWWKEGLRKRGK